MKSTLTIAPLGENLSIEESLYYQNLIEEGYTHPLLEIRIDSSNFDKIKSELNSKYNMTVYKYHSEETILEVWKSVIFSITIVKEAKNTYISTYCNSEESKEILYNIISSYEPKSDDVSIFMDNYYIQSGRLDSKLKIYESDSFDYANKMYYPYIKTNTMFEQLYAHSENILILCGEPGTGKTSLGAQLLKYSVDNILKLHKDDLDMDGVRVAYIKSTEVLAMDEFWRSLAAKEYDLVFLDDLDYFLTSRNEELQTSDDAEKNKFLSQFLSFTDGIEQNETKFIITTNQPFDDIDDALLRKGRLFDILELRKLTNEEALNVWTSAGLLKEKFIFAGDVLQADLGSEIEKHLNKEIKIEQYLLEDNISKIKKFNKKIGF